MKECTNPLRLLVCGTYRMGLLELECASDSPGELVLQTARPHPMIPSDAAAAGPGNQ